MSGKPRPCGCKGYRTCLLCEKEFNLSPFNDDSFTREALLDNVLLTITFLSVTLTTNSKVRFFIVLFAQGILSYVYCSSFNLAWPGWDCCVNNHPNHEGEPVPFAGIYVQVSPSACTSEDLLTVFAL